MKLLKVYRTKKFSIGWYHSAIKGGYVCISLGFFGLWIDVLNKKGAI